MFNNILLDNLDIIDDIIDEEYSILRYYYNKLALSTQIDM